MAGTYIGSCLFISAADLTGALANTESGAGAVAGALLTAAITQAAQEVGGVISIAELGDTAEDVSFDLLKGGRRTHVNGVRDVGDVDVSLEYLSNDNGQNRIRTLANSNTSVAFRIMDDNPGTNQQVAFVGVIANYRESERTASSYKGCMFTMRGQSRLEYGTS